MEDALKVLGDFPVQVRQYAEGAEVRREIKRLQESIALYMKELEPGGRYTKTRFTKEQAETTLEGGMKAMAADLYRVGIRCEVTRTKVPKVRAPKVHPRLLIPKDVRERLVIREDDFAEALQSGRKTVSDAVRRHRPRGAYTCQWAS
ncbi:hypothetical protein GCM10010306_015570 [Streptomyces umbrinus]|nr:hypothetical protein GCM10010306_015570 [Streptomyces umbrinus]